MKKILSIFICSILFNVATSQSISPLLTDEYCPGVEYTFTATITKPYQSMIGEGGCFVTQLPASPVGTTFTFKGKFGDANQKQTFRIYFTDNTSYPFDFKKIKSLFYNNTASCALIQPSQTTINAPSCQLSNFNISFSNVQWQTAFENPTLCFGSITTYEYLLPTGWKLGTATSNGSTWLAGNNNVTITSNLIGGGQIAIRPTNNCNSGLQNGQTPRYITINRTNAPVLKINGSTSLTIYCGDAGAKTFTVENAGSCITSYEWQVANKGWYDANGNLIT
ncbi:MAG: hypothetical protein ACOYVG_16315, partial [Bacteroidota bacterium]